MGNRLAMFPDAVTERGSPPSSGIGRTFRGRGERPAVLFVVHWPKAEYFLPDFHTDLHFARTMLACREQVRFFPVSVRWKKDLSLDSKTRLLTIPWDFIEREAEDRGSYLLILKLGEGKTIPIGKMGNIVFPAWILYLCGFSHDQPDRPDGTAPRLTKKSPLAYRLFKTRSRI